MYPIGLHTDLLAKSIEIKLKLYSRVKYDSRKN